MFLSVTCEQCHCFGAGSGSSCFSLQSLQTSHSYESFSGGSNALTRCVSLRSRRREGRNSLDFRQRVGTLRLSLDRIGPTSGCARGFPLKKHHRRERERERKKKTDKELVASFTYAYAYVATYLWARRRSLCSECAAPAESRVVSTQ